MKKEYLIIEEDEAAQLLSPDLAINVMRKCFEEKALGTFYALPKYNIQGKHGALRITPGESSDMNIIGFRLYDVIRADYENQPQITLVYDNTSGKLKGMVVSQLLGAYRTAAINAVMHHGLKKKMAETLGVIGTGYQARIHFQMFYQLLQPKRVLVYGRTQANVKKFVAEMLLKLPDATINICKGMEQLKVSDSLLLATNSRKPLLKKGFFSQGVTVTTIGPKRRGASEVSEGFAESCDLIVTDTMEQVESYGQDFFISNYSRMADYADLLAKKRRGRTNDNEKILICSLGMGGTEVALANKLIEKKHELL